MNRDELVRTCFGRDDLWQGERIFELTDGNDVISHVDLSYRRVLVHRPTGPGPGVSEASTMFTVAAIGNVCTDPAHRGKGHAADLLAAAHAEAATHETVRFAALFAGGAALPLYARLGYYHPEGADDAAFMVCPLVREPEPLQSSDADGVVVWEGHPPVETPEWPAGRVDTRGTW